MGIVDPLIECASRYCGLGHVILASVTGEHVRTQVKCRQNGGEPV